MADIDYDDDELFADLYADDNADAKPSASEAAVQSEPEPAQAPAQAKTDTEAQPDPSYQDNGDGEFTTGYNDADGFQNSGDLDQNEYGDQQNGGAQAVSSSIGIKEDG